MVAQGLPWKAGDRVVTTILEHHSNLLPWYNLAERGVGVDVVGIRDDYSIDLSAFEAAITPDDTPRCHYPCVQRAWRDNARCGNREDLP